MASSLPANVQLQNRLSVTDADEGLGTLFNKTSKCLGTLIQDIVEGETAKACLVLTLVSHADRACRHR